VIDRLTGATDEQLSHLHLMPTCGTQYYRYEGGEWKLIYAENLSDEERDRALAACEEEARRLGFWSDKTWGPILENRGSQITFSALGQSAPVDEKKKWDPTGEKKSALRDAIQGRLPDLEVRSGGSTSIDITRKGVDKAYGMSHLATQTGIPLDDMIFVGDRLDPAGNDYPVKALGVPCVAVTGPDDTARYLSGLLHPKA
jgi:phosphomannomutase